MDATFTSFLWPVLGIVFLPFTTLIYVLLWRPGTGVTSWDWLWIGLAVFLDLAHWSASASQRNAASRSTPSTTGPRRPPALRGQGARVPPLDRGARRGAGDVAGRPARTTRNARRTTRRRG